MNLLYMGRRVLAEHQSLFMAAQCNRAGYYIFALWFLSSIYLFPGLNSAVVDWMSAILAHMVWP